ncbi:hypothetical protein [Phenylobacterium sp.]|uniref:hypothetical protein n=1 Tax=Phenylobacterium sp. TaxID=1871053 RepID=UPI0039831951
MLSKGDDYPIHQTPEPIAYAGSDRNFYDRYFFNGYSPDGLDFFAVAFGVYPHLNVADAHLSIVRDGVQRCLHASRILNMERMDLVVGPIRIEVLEPLQRLKVTVERAEGLACELTFEGRAFPIEEPRFTKRIGPRLFMDYTRLTQNVRVAGWLEVDGERRELGPGWTGSRDRSWGIRPVGAPDTQATPGAGLTGFFWQWTPINFQDRSVFFHVNADPDGRPWNTRAVILPDGSGPDAGWHAEAPRMEEVTLRQGTRHAERGVLKIPLADGEVSIALEPVTTFLMRGIGYGGEWRHGALKGELAVAREDIDLAAIDMGAPENLHIQAISTAVMQSPGEPDRSGVGVFEQLIAGPYRPYGLG